MWISSGGPRPHLAAEQAFIGDGRGDLGLERTARSRLESDVAAMSTGRRALRNHVWGPRTNVDVCCDGATSTRSNSEPWSMRHGHPRPECAFLRTERPLSS